MKIIFMGTPDFAVPTLEALINAGHEITLVVTQPDKPKGRGKEVQFTPVKECAVKNNIPVFQPVKIKEQENVEKLWEYEADLYVVVAFGQILTKEILEHPKYGCINVHASILPKYRGAAPIQWAVIDGEKITGVTIQQMDIGVDTGDILSKYEYELADDETGGSLYDRLMTEGAKLCVKTVDDILAGTVTKTPQNEEDTCYAKKIDKQLGNIDWTYSADRIERLIRGLNPWPSAYTFYNGKMLKIWRAHIEADKPDSKPGEIFCENGKLSVSTGEGMLVLDEIQLEGKKRMATEAFLRGFTINNGEILSNTR